MKKIWLKRLGIAAVVVGVLLVGVDTGLHVLSGREWARRKITEKLAQVTGREVTLGRVVFNLRGASVKNFVIAKPGGLSEGEFFRIGHAHVKVSLWHLLHGELHISAVGIEGLSLHVVRDEKGKLNTQFYPEEPNLSDEPSAATPMDMAVEELSARKIEITYTDIKKQIRTELKDAEITIRDFSWDKPFEINTHATLAYQPGSEPFSAKLSLAARAYLAGLDLPKAYAEISAAELRAGNTRAKLSGRVENLENPDFDLELDGQKFSHQNLAPFVPADFPLDIPRLSVLIKGKALLSEEKLQLAKSSLSLPGLETSVKGTAEWSRGAYNMTAQLQAQLGELSESLLFLKPYALAGNLALEAAAVPKQITLRGELRNGEFQVAQTGKFSELQVALDAAENIDFTKGQGVLGLTGKLNSEDFKADFSFSQTAKEIVVKLSGSADKLILPPAKKEVEPAQAKDTPPAAAVNEKTAWKLPPITAKANVKIGALDAPYINGKDFDFRVDMSGITPRLDEAHGTFLLSVYNGEITDLYHLTDSNALMKVLFMSLNIVGKVFNSLDVLSVLGGLTGGGSNDKNAEVIKMIPNEDGEMVAVKVPASSRKVDGRLAYDKFVTDVSFEHGVASVKKGSFVSDMMSFNLSGTTDFKTEKIKMTVHAAPGAHETDGVMPLTLHIGGTVSNPDGNMSVVGSVASLMTQGVTNNFASRAVKKSLGSVWGLFKKKERPEESAQEPNVSGPNEPEQGEAVQP